MKVPFRYSTSGGTDMVPMPVACGRNGEDAQLATGNTPAKTMTASIFRIFGILARCYTKPALRRWLSAAATRRSVQRIGSTPRIEGILAADASQHRDDAFDAPDSVVEREHVFGRATGDAEAM